MRINLDSMTEDQLRALNREIIRRLEALSFARQKMQLLAFKIGDRVEFDSDRGTIVGTIVRINQKTASIHIDDGPGYRVSPVFLRKVSSARDVTSSQGKLFQFRADEKA